ncbi:MAG TPA: gluconolaconase, partial [Telluria sp.]|nr:gluconolaconase [Telluria sp.]
ADGWDNYYVADTGNSTVRMIKKGVVSTLAGQAGQCGGADGRAGAARFCSPAGITSDTQGNLYVADTANSAIRWINIDNNVRTLAGTGQSGNVLGPLPGGLDHPVGAAILDKDAVAVTSRNLVLKLVPGR